MAKKKAATSGTSHLLKDLNLSAEHQGIVDLVHESNAKLRAGSIPKEHVAEVQKLVKDHVVHLHKNLPKETVTQIFTRLAPAEGERNALREAVSTSKPKYTATGKNIGETIGGNIRKGLADLEVKHEAESKALAAKLKSEEPARRAADKGNLDHLAPRPENLGDIIDKNKAKLESSSDYKPAKYPKRISDEEPVVTKPKKSGKKVSPWKDVVNPEVKSESPKELAASWKQGTPEEVAAKRKGLFGGGEEVVLSGASKLQSAGPTLDITESKKAAAKAHNERAATLRAADKSKPADLHTTIDTKSVLADKGKEQKAADKGLAAQLKKATAENKRLRTKAGAAISPTPTPAPPEVGTGEVKLSISNPPPPPAPAPATTKTVVAEPVAAKVAPAAIAEAAKAPALAGVEKLEKVAKPKANPVGKKITNIFEELKTSVEGRKDTPKAAGSRAAIFEAGQKLEAKPEKPATVKSIFKGLTPGKGDPLAKLAVSVEGENLKQASRAGTTPDVESPRAKLRLEMDEAGKAMKRFDPVKKYTPPVKLTRPPLELPEEKAAKTYRPGMPSPSAGVEAKIAKAESKGFPGGIGREDIIAAEAKTPEWLGVARKAATAAEEGATISKAAKVGELASKTAGKLGKLGIAGLAIYGGIEALKKIGEKLKE